MSETMTDREIAWNLWREMDDEPLIEVEQELAVTEKAEAVFRNALNDPARADSLLICIEVGREYIAQRKANTP